MKKSHGPMGLQRNSVKDSQKDEEEEERRREEGKEGEEAKRSYSTL